MNHFASASPSTNLKFRHASQLKKKGAHLGELQRAFVEERTWSSLKLAEQNVPLAGGEKKANGQNCFSTSHFLESFLISPDSRHAFLFFAKKDALARQIEAASTVRVVNPDKLASFKIQTFR